MAARCRLGVGRRRRGGRRRGARARGRRPGRADGRRRGGAGAAALDGRGRRPRGSGSVLPAPRAAGLPFPYWEDRFGWRATGFRRDDVGGRGATTIVYRRAGARIAYTIVAGDALRTGAATRRTVLRGTAVRAFRRDGREVVTWQRRGHTCVLSGAATSRDELLRLAAWTGGGELPY